MSRISPVIIAEAFLFKDKEILRLRAEIEKLRLELDMLQATVMVPSQKDDQLRIEHLNAALVAALDEAAKLRAALKPFADRVDDFIPEKHDAHRALVTLGEIRAAAAALKETGDE